VTEHDQVMDGVEPPEDPAADLAVDPSLDEVEADAAEAVDPLAAALAERDDYLGALQRLQADFENFRKRVARDQELEAARVAAGIVRELLIVCDTLDLAQAHLADGEDAAAEASALVAARAQLLEVLSKAGLDRVDAVGAPFDPTVHDAVAHAPGVEGASEETIEEVLRAGYVFRGQVLRPAMVRVRG